MFNRRVRAWGLGSLGALVVSFPACGQVVILQQNFDTPPAPFFTYGYDYAGYGDTTFAGHDNSGASNNTFETEGNGRGGGNALLITGDFTNVVTSAPPDHTYIYYGFGGGIGIDRPAGLPSPNLSDYVVSLDLAFGGLLAPTASGNVEIQLTLPDDTLRNDGDTDRDPFANIVFGASSGTAYTTTTMNLGGATVDFNEDNVPENQRDFSLHYANLFAQFNFNVDGGNGSTFGHDAGNRILIDNVLFTAVPEPSAAAILGAVMLLARRRARAR